MSTPFKCECEMKYRKTINGIQGFLLKRNSFHLWCFFHKEGKAPPSSAFEHIYLLWLLWFVTICVHPQTGFEGKKAAQGGGGIVTGRVFWKKQKRVAQKNMESGTPLPPIATWLLCKRRSVARVQKVSFISPCVENHNRK